MSEGPGSGREPWHLREAALVVEGLGSDEERGLSAEEAAARLADIGPNVLRPSPPTPPWRIFLGQFDDFMIWVLFAAVVISALEGEIVDAIAITAILVLNGVLGFVQEYRAQRALAVRAIEPSGLPAVAGETVSSGLEKINVLTLQPKLHRNARVLSVIRLHYQRSYARGPGLRGQADGDGALGFLVENVAEERLDSVDRNVLAGEGGVGSDADQGAFQAADGGFDFFCQENQYLLG